MSESPQETQRGLFDNSWMLPVILGSMTLITSGLLMLSHVITKDKIAAIELASKLDSLQRIIPAQLIDNDLLADAVTVFEPAKLGHRGPETLYLGKRNNQTTLMAIPVTARNGYSGDIKLLVGIHTTGELKGQITAVEIIAHKETPGLGDLIEANKSDWLTQFPGTSLQQPDIQNWAVKKDQGKFDQITAATITPRAAVSAIKQALLYAKDLNLKQLPERKTQKQPDTSSIYPLTEEQSP